MTLTAIYQQNNHKGILESDIRFTVDYNPDMDSIDSIIHVQVYNHKERILTDVTAVLWDMFEPGLDNMLESINWRRVYANTIIDNIIHTA